MQAIQTQEDMNEQMEKWLEEHPAATLKEAWRAGYFQAVENWCKQKR